MTFPAATLDALCPLHARLDLGGRIRQVGPTLAKLLDGHDPLGQPFDELLEIYRPQPVRTVAHLSELAGRKLQLRLRHGARTGLRGVAMPDDSGGMVLNLSFGIGVVEAVRTYALTATDFAVTDLAIDMLYLVEAKSAAMEASRTLNRRLQGAMLAAEQRAYTDPLTGLRNRRAMDHVLERLIRGGERFALMHVDLDHFKQVNDTRGHAAGDRVLQSVARSMLELTRKDDTVVRIGGDEFVIILNGFPDTAHLADLAARLIRRIETPIRVEGRECRISASIGIALGSATGDASGDAVDLLERADIALYRAKREGRSRHAFYLPAELSEESRAGL